MSSSCHLFLKNFYFQVNMFHNICEVNIVNNPPQLHRHYPKVVDTSQKVKTSHNTAVLIHFSLVLVFILETVT